MAESTLQLLRQRQRWAITLGSLPDQFDKQQKNWQQIKIHLNLQDVQINMAFTWDILPHDRCHWWGLWSLFYRHWCPLFQSPGHCQIDINSFKSMDKICIQKTTNLLIECALDSPNFSWLWRISGSHIPMMFFSFLCITYGSNRSSIFWNLSCQHTEHKAIIINKN